MQILKKKAFIMEDLERSCENTKNQLSKYLSL